MDKITVSDLAKQLKVSSKLITSLLSALDMTGVTNDTVIDAPVVKAVSDVVLREKAKKAAEKAKQEELAAKATVKPDVVQVQSIPAQPVTPNRPPVSQMPAGQVTPQSTYQQQNRPQATYANRADGQGQRPQGGPRPQNAPPQDRRPYTPHPMDQSGAPRPQGQQGQQGQPDRRPYPPRQGNNPPQQGQMNRPYQGTNPPPQGQGQRPPYQPRPQVGSQGGPQGTFQERRSYPPRQPGDSVQPRPQGSYPPSNRPPGPRPAPGSPRADSRTTRPVGNRPAVVPPPPTVDKPLAPSNKMVKKDRKYSDERYRTQERMFSSEEETSGKAPRSSKARKNNRNKPIEKIINTQIPTHIELGGSVTVKVLSDLLKTDVASVIKKLMQFGIMAAMNQEIDLDTATLVVQEFGSSVVAPKEAFNPETIIVDADDTEEELLPRAPVVTVMGHVDHGKTSLLDAIRSSNVAAKEAGGITQHIGAHTTEIKGKKITFLDTPGHEAFTSMRARGAQVTDIAVLVVAADDGVMPQTIEAINHAKNAKVPIIVAINKVDRPNAQPERVKQELTEYGLIAEEWGGDTMMVNVSALKRQGIDELLESIIVLAEVMELTANPNRKAVGTVIEAKLDKGRGPVASVLVHKGTLNIGDIMIVGRTFGRVRAMIDDKGRRIKKAGPSTPVEVVGLSEVPDSSDPFYVVEDERQARQLAETRASNQKIEEQQKSSRVTLEDLFSQMNTGEVKDLNLILKADVHGSVEAIKASLVRLSTPEIRVNIIHTGVGAVSETDVMLASASNAIIIGFNIRPDQNAAKAAELQHVDIRTYRIIYEIVDDVEAAMKGLLAPVMKESVIGHVEIREIFKISKVGSIAGCYVTDGKVTRNSMVRVVRDGTVVHEGPIESLRRIKDDVREVASGYECGIMLQRFNDLKIGDRFEIFVKEEVKRTEL